MVIKSVNNLFFKAKCNSFLIVFTSDPGLNSCHKLISETLAKSSLIICVLHSIPRGGSNVDKFNISLAQRERDITFTSLPWPYRLLVSPVLGRRVGRTQMEESKTLGCGCLNVYEQIQKKYNGMREQ